LDENPTFFYLQGNRMKYIILMMIFFTFSFSNMTLCYKNGHNDMASIENVAFDGAECKGKKSISDMKKEGWIVDDIQIKNHNGNFNFVYILKNKQLTQQQIPQKIDYQELAKEVESQKKVDKARDFAIQGKKSYLMHCASCHGDKGELTPHGSRAINQFDYQEMSDLLYLYTIGEYENSGSGIIMEPYGSTLSEDEIKGAVKYLETQK
jgi:mono/diheme cytochrome c family protein